MAKPRRRGAFTLVELLVVVGIISALIAILLPAVSRAREQANRIECGANLRSLGQAITMYTQQYRCFPGCWVLSGPGEYYAVWPTRLRPYLGGERRVFYCPSQDERCAWGNDPVPGPPASGELLKFGYEPGEPLLHTNSWFSYGYNLWGPTPASWPARQRGLGAFVNVIHPEVPNIYPELPVGQLGQASEKIIIADTTADGHWDVAIHPGPDTSFMYPARVHGGGANVLFGDGHVNWYLQKDMLDLSRSTESGPNPESVAMWRRWNVTFRS